MLNLPEELKKEIEETDKLKKTLSKKELIKNINSLKKEVKEENIDIELKKRDFINEIKDKNIFQEINELKKEKQGFFKRLKIILGL